MADDALPLPHQRSVRAIMRAVRASPRGSLVVCLGRVASVRDAVEAELTAELAPGATLVRAALRDPAAEPWGAMLAARDGTARAASEVVVSFAVLAAPGADETLVVIVNLSSQPYAGVVQAGPGPFRDISPEWRKVVPAAVNKPDAPAVRELSAVALGPWEFRVFSRVKP